jgi:hypothetical protein
MLVLLPMCMKSMIERPGLLPSKAPSIFTAANTDILDPNRLIERRLAEEPRSTKLRMLMALPNRPNDRKLREEPNWHSSSTETDEPTLAKLRIDRLDDKLTKSITLAALPNLA